MLFDLGTGLRYFGATWPSDRPFRGTCLLSHLHWDHTQGLPFFGPVLRPGAELDIYAPAQDDGRPVAEAFDTMISPPLFPVCVDQLPGIIRYHDMADGQFTIGDIEVMARLIPHVGNTLGYRVTWNGHSVAYLSDHQMPYDGSHQAADAALELASGVDLLIHDAQYTVDEFPAKYNWGHCTIDYAVWFAMEAGVRRLALFHHDPSRDDASIDRLAEDAAATAAPAGVEVIAAREGLVVELR